MPILPPQNKPQTRAGTGFTNLQKYLQANKANLLGQTVAGRVQEAGQAARGAITQAGQKFQEQAATEQARQASQAERAQKVLGDVTKASEEDIKAFEGIRAGMAQTPIGIQDAAQLGLKAQEAQRLGQATGSATGRLGLLQQFVGEGKRYTGGQQVLDAMLLGKAGAEQLKQTRRGTMGLGQQLQQQKVAAEEVGKELSASAKGLAQKTIEELGKQSQATEEEIKAALDITQAQEKQRQQAMDDIRSLLTGRGQSAIYDDAGKELRAAIAPSKERLDDINKALSLAQIMGVLQEGDVSSIENLQRKLSTPIEKMTRQQVQYGPSGYLGYGGAAPGQTYEYSGGYKFSGLNLGDLIAQSLATEGPKGLTREGVASDVQRAKANVLAKLSGIAPEFAEQPAEKFTGSKGAFGFEKAQRLTDEDIARLRAEAITELPAEYMEVPGMERLRRTIAPTAAEVSQDTVKDLEKMFGSEQGVTDRGKALLSAALAPTRLGAGLVTEGGTDLANKTNQILSNYLTLKPANVAQGALQSAALLPAVGANLATDILKGTGNLVSAVPLIGKPISNIVLKPITSVAQSVSNAVQSFFCYGTGTLIKMKDGKYKPVEKIKVGDVVALGGRVTAAGVSEAANLFKYKETIINGSHAVFENDNFIRVRDSKLAVPIKEIKNIKLHPVETENHLLVTKTHISSDFSEVPGGAALDEKQRLEKLNSEQNRNEKLKKLSKLMEIESGNKKIR